MFDKWRFNSIDRRLDQIEEREKVWSNNSMGGYTVTHQDLITRIDLLEQYLGVVQHVTPLTVKLVRDFRNQN